MPNDRLYKIIVVDLPFLSCPSSMDCVTVSVNPNQEYDLVDSTMYAVYYRPFLFLFPVPRLKYHRIAKLTQLITDEKTPKTYHPYYDWSTVFRLSFAQTVVPVDQQVFYSSGTLFFLSSGTLIPISGIDLTFRYFPESSV